MAKKKAQVEKKITTVTRINPKSVIGKIGALESNTPLYSVRGVVNNVKSRETIYGSITELQGNFMAHTLSGDAAVYMSNKCSLTHGFHAAIENRIAQVKGPVYIAFDVAAEPTTATPGYELTYTPLIDITRYYALECIQERIQAAIDSRKLAD